MSDDIRELSQSSAFSPIRRTTHSGARERLTEEQRERQEREQEDAREGGEGETPEQLSERIAKANARLQVKNSDVRLRIAGEPTSPVVEVTLADDSGKRVVARTMAPGDVAEWLGGIETSEGLLLDDEL